MNLLRRLFQQRRVRQRLLLERQMLQNRSYLSLSRPQPWVQPPLQRPLPPPSRNHSRWRGR